MICKKNYFVLNKKFDFDPDLELPEKSDPDHAKNLDPTGPDRIQIRHTAHWCGIFGFAQLDLHS